MVIIRFSVPKALDLLSLLWPFVTLSGVKEGVFDSPVSFMDAPQHAFLGIVFVRWMWRELLDKFLMVPPILAVFRLKLFGSDRMDCLSIHLFHR